MNVVKAIAAFVVAWLFCVLVVCAFAYLVDGPAAFAPTSEAELEAFGYR